MKVFLVGLALQMASFALFASVYAVFLYRVFTKEKGIMVADDSKPWYNRWTMLATALVFSCIGILVSIFIFWKKFGATATLIYRIMFYMMKRFAKIIRTISRMPDYETIALSTALLLFFHSVLLVLLNHNIRSDHALGLPNYQEVLVVLYPEANGSSTAWTRFLYSLLSRCMYLFGPEGSSRTVKLSAFRQ